MFERFTDRARRVVVLAQEEARLLNHNYIGSEHILLGLAREDQGLAAKALSSLGVSLSDARADVREIIGEGQAPPTGHIPFTPRAKKILELSLREAQQMGSNYLGTEHILLGLVREGSGAAVQVLQKREVDLDRVRQTVLQLLSGSSGEGATTHAETATESQASEPRPLDLPDPRGRPSASDIGDFLRRLQLGRQRSGHTARPEDVPVCPTCFQPLSRTAGLRRVELDVDGEPHQVNIVYCTSCGTAFGSAAV